MAGSFKSCDGPSKRFPRAFLVDLRVRELLEAVLGALLGSFGTLKVNPTRT